MSDQSLDEHVNVVSAKCFFQLRQLRLVRRSLDDDSVATLVHAFMTNRDDYCSSLHIWRSEEDDRQVATCPQLGSTNRLEHALVRPGTHSLPAKSATLAGRYRPGSVQSLRPGLHKMAPEYLSSYCQPVSGISGRRHLRSAYRGHLDFPRVKLASYGGRSFAYAGPSN